MEKDLVNKVVAVMKRIDFMYQLGARIKHERYAKYRRIGLSIEGIARIEEVSPQEVKEVLETYIFLPPFKHPKRKFIRKI